MIPQHYNTFIKHFPSETLHKFDLTYRTRLSTYSFIYFRFANNVSARTNYSLNYFSILIKTYFATFYFLIFLCCPYHSLLLTLRSNNSPIYLRFYLTDRHKCRPAYTHHLYIFTSISSPIRRNVTRPATMRNKKYLPHSS